MVETLPGRGRRTGRRYCDQTFSGGATGNPLLYCTTLNVLCRYELVVILFQSDASDEVLCVTTAGFGGDVDQKRLTDEENCVEVSLNHVHNRLY